MAKPTKEQLKRWAENHHRLWNAGDKEGFLKNLRSVAPGEIRMQDPRGTAWKDGFEAQSNAFDLWQPITRFKIHEAQILPGKGPEPICFIIEAEDANEVIWVLENHIDMGGGKTEIATDVELFSFKPDGSLVIYAYLYLPERTDDSLSKHIDEYHPEEGEEWEKKHGKV